MRPPRPLQPDPIARLNLPAPVENLAEASADQTDPPPVETPDFPPEAAAVSEGAVEFPSSAPAASESGFATEARPALGGVPSEYGAALDGQPQPDHPTPFSALERYRLEQDRELLRQMAYQRHFVHGFRDGGFRR